MVSFPGAGYTVLQKTDLLSPEANSCWLSLARVRMLCLISLHAWIWICFGFPKPYAHCHNHCEFIRSAALLCPEDTISLVSSTTSGSDTLSVPSASRTPEPREESFSLFHHTAVFFSIFLLLKIYSFIPYILRFPLPKLHLEPTYISSHAAHTPLSLHRKQSGPQRTN